METMYSTMDSPQTDLFLEEPAIPASFGERFMAVFIDCIILVILNLALDYFLDSTLSNFIGTITNWLYFAIQESSEQQATIGKKALGLKVTSITGQRISFGQATGRHFAQYISALILGIGYFMVLWDVKKQALHDKIANTLVVKR